MSKVLVKFDIKINEDREYTLESKISGHKIKITPSRGNGNNSKESLIWTILEDLREEGNICNE